MPTSKTIPKTSAEMRAARAHGESRTDWDRVRRNANREPGAAEENRCIGETITRKHGRPVVGEAKAAISLRVPVSVLEHWKASWPGWQTRMVEMLSRHAP